MSNSIPLGYRQYQPGHLNGSSLECAQCSKGLVTMVEGLSQCSPCTPLTATSSQYSCTSCPKNARGTARARACVNRFFLDTLCWPRQGREIGCPGNSRPGQERRVWVLLCALSRKWKLCVTKYFGLRDQTSARIFFATGGRWNNVFRVPRRYVPRRRGEHVPQVILGLDVLSATS